MNVYESIPTMEKGEIRLRPVTAADDAALLRVYGDPLALPLFNSDNCHGDIFYYDTPEKMRRAMDFWRTSWEQGWFVRWAIALRSEVIGTVELCRREESPDDPYSGMGILRVDVGTADILQIVKLGYHFVATLLCKCELLFLGHFGSPYICLYLKHYCRLPTDPERTDRSIHLIILRICDLIDILVFE